MMPDVGRFLYKHVHSLHHKSYNPTAFSGTSMHPVEAFMYVPHRNSMHPVEACMYVPQLYAPG
jgi:sterol desaturase/sphingolipid hydroxylase (fatty acid hydroxylase superfamily)